MLPKYIKKDGIIVYYDGDGEFVFYVPEFYFESSYAVIEGEYVTVLGILQYEVFDSKKKSLTKVKNFKHASCFTTKPAEIEKAKNIKVGKLQGDYRLLHYYKGDQIVCSTKTAQDIANVEMFFRLFTSGKQPTFMPYNTIQDYFINVARLNGMNYGVGHQVIGVAITELYRDLNDVSIPYRLSKNFDNINYRPLPILEIPKYTNAFTAMTSESIDDALASAVINKNTTYTPLEKLVTDK